jgi:hypothetical protein
VAQPSFFVKINAQTEKSSPIVLATSEIFFKKPAQSKQSTKRRKFAQSGHPVGM